MSIGAAATERRSAAESLAAFVRADVQEALSAKMDAPPPPWQALVAVISGARRGWPPDWRRLDETLERVRQYRAECGLGDDDAGNDLAGLLGPVPKNRRLAAVRASLATELRDEPRPIDRSLGR